MPLKLGLGPAGARGNNATALISTYYDAGPSAGSLDITGLPWFDAAQGFIWASITINSFAGSADQYPIEANDGTSANTLGLRVFDSNERPGARIRGGNSNLFASTTNEHRIRPAAKRVIGLAWDGSGGYLLSGGTIRTFSYSGTIQGIDTLWVGSRNAGADPLDGTVHEFEIGNRYLSPAVLAARMKRPETIVIAGGGQSLAAGYWVSNESGGDAGYAGLLDVLGPESGKEIIAINGATGGSALSVRNTSVGNYWYDDLLEKDGPALDTWFAAAADNFSAPDWLLWTQGEQDSFFIGKEGEMTKAEYKTLLLTVFERMREVYPGLQVLLQPIGRRTGAHANPGGTQAVREAQYEIVAENSWIHPGAETFDLPLYDDVHLADAGYAAAAQRNARKLTNLLGGSLTGVDGPVITGADRSGTAVTVTIIHDGGSDFTPASGIEGFKFFDDGSEIPITAAVRTDSTTITLTLATAPSGDGWLFYACDRMESVTAASLVMDDAAVPMPLRPVYNLPVV